jgi:hypothetical protein
MSRLESRIKADQAELADLKRKACLMTAGINVEASTELVKRANRLLDPALYGSDPMDDAYEVAKAFLNTRINEDMIRRVSMDVVVKAGFEWYGTPQTSSTPDTRGLKDFRLGVEALAKALIESLP